MQNNRQGLHKVEQNDAELNPLASRSGMLGGCLVRHAVEHTEYGVLGFLVQGVGRGRLTQCSTFHGERSRVCFPVVHVVHLRNTHGASFGQSQQKGRPRRVHGAQELAPHVYKEVYVRGEAFAWCCVGTVFHKRPRLCPVTTHGSAVILATVSRQTRVSVLPLLTISCTQ